MYCIKNDAKIRYLQFLKQYENILPKDLEKKINSGNQIDKTYFEIVTFLHAIPDKLNPMNQFVFFLKENFPNITEKVMLEYSYNYLPSLSLSCQNILNLKNSPIAYSKKTFFSTFSKINCVKEKEKIPKKDLVIAFLLDSLEEILEIVQEEKIECAIQTIPKREYTEEEYYQYLINRKRELMKNSPELETTLTFNSFSNMVSSPIFLTRKKVKENGL